MFLFATAFNRRIIQFERDPRRIEQKDLVQTEVGDTSVYIGDLMSLAARAHLKPIFRQECDVIERTGVAARLVRAIPQVIL
jgi:hypothetical protein